MTENRIFAPSFQSMRYVDEYTAYGAARFPDRIAILGDRGQLSYRELERASNRFAVYLQALGLEAGSRIAYLGKNSEMFFPVLFGCIRAGMVMVPINWRYASNEVAYVINDARAAILIYDDDTAASAQAAAEQLEHDVMLLPVNAQRDHAASLRSVIDGDSDAALQPANDDPDRCVLQLYTSGTTGKPKGVMLSHRAISVARWVEVGSPDWADWNDDDIILSGMPNFHAGGLSWMLIGLLRSLTCVLTADPSPATLLALCRQHSITRTFLVPAVVRAIVDDIEASDIPPPPIKTIYYGAAPMDAALIEKCMRVLGNCGFAQYYGMTEAAGAVTFMAPREHDPHHPERLHSVGRALPAYDIEVRDADGHRLQAGQHGELWIRSPALMSGYWRLPQATAEVLIDGWYRTGDGGYMDADGYIFLTDRIKDMIITGGENVYPVEVEAVLRLHPAIQDVVVVGVADKKWGEAVCAVVEWRPGHDATLEALQVFARNHMAAYKIPRRLWSMASLPRTATGKLQRAEVRKRILGI